MPGARVRGAPGRAAAAKSRGQGAEEHAARRGVGVRSVRRPSALVLFDVHRIWGYSAIVANFLAGAYTLGAWRWPRWRTRWLWWPTIVAESMMMVQVLRSEER